MMTEPKIRYSAHLRAQSGTEFLMLAAVSLATLLAVYIVAFSQINSVGTIMKSSILRQSLDELAQAAGEVHSQGIGARKLVEFQLPAGLNYSSVGRNPSTGAMIKTIYVNYLDGISLTHAYASTGCNVDGLLPMSMGAHRVWVTAIPGGAYIGNLSYDVDSPSVSFILSPVQSKSSILKVTSLVNVATTYSITETISGEDNELDVTPSSFSLDAQQSINLTILAEAGDEEDSAGIYFGNITIKESSSGINMSVPVTIEVG